MGDELEHDEVGELPLLAGIAACLRWCEELVVLCSGPLLLVGLGIGLVALLSDGALLLTAPWLLYAWALSQTVGVDGQLVGAWYRVSVAIARRRWGVALAFVLLGLLLAYIAYVASLVFATQQAYHLTTGQALAHLGMDSTSWLWQRSAISVLLVCLSGYLRYRAPRNVIRSLEERKRAIQEHMELDALKREQRAQQARGAVRLLRGVAEAARGQDSSQDRSDGSAAPGAAPPSVSVPRDPAAPREGREGARVQEGEEGDLESAVPFAAAPASLAALPMVWPTQAARTTSDAGTTSQNGHLRR